MYIEKIKMISVIIPAFNEEKRLPDTIDEIINYFKHLKLTFEIIIIDDGSTDSTKDIILKKYNFKNINYLRNKINKGKGFSIKKGVLNAKGDLILFTDADLSTPIFEFEKLKEYLNKGYDIAIASRALKFSKIEKHQNILRETMGKIFNLIVRLILLKEYHDTQCGFKLFKSTVAKEIFPKTTIDGFAFDVEILILAKILKFKVIETPVIWSNSPESKINPIKDSIKMLKDLIKLRKKYLIHMKHLQFHD